MSHSNPITKHHNTVSDTTSEMGPSMHPFWMHCFLLSSILVSLCSPSFALFCFFGHLRFYFLCSGVRCIAFPKLSIKNLSQYPRLTTKIRPSGSVVDNFQSTQQAFGILSDHCAHARMNHQCLKQFLNAGQQRLCRPNDQYPFLLPCESSSLQSRPSLFSDSI